MYGELKPLPNTSISFCLYHTLLNSYTWILAFCYFPLERKHIDES